MVSHNVSQVNINRTHIKSMQEMTHRSTSTYVDASTRTDPVSGHDSLCRTQSEEPPRSPYDPQFISRQHYDFDASHCESTQSETFNRKCPHTRNLSQDSANSMRTDVSLSQVSRESGGSTVHFSEQLTFSRPGSTMTEPEQWDQSYSTHSLPRQRCNRHRPEFRSLPRRTEPYHYRHPTNHHFQMTDSYNSIQSSNNSVNNHDDEESLDSPRIYENIESLKRQMETLQRRRSSIHSSTRPVLIADEPCSACASDVEQEIIIDFKPQISHLPSPRPLKKTLHKQMSEGKLPSDTHFDVHTIASSMGSASEEDLKTPNEDDPPKIERYSYRNQPIKDEGICDHKQLLTPSQEDSVSKIRRDAFRKRSLSTEEGSMDDLSTHGPVLHKLSTPTSPCFSAKAHSDFPSNDSLSTDWTRDNSDGIWNESQATVLNADPRYLSKITFC